MVYIGCKSIRSAFTPHLIEKVFFRKRIVRPAVLFLWSHEMIGKGREIIYTPYKEINASNVIEVVVEAMKIFQKNSPPNRKNKQMFAYTIAHSFDKIKLF